jgi:hypothetical protein
MMDPATARVALRLQLDDVDAIIKTLPSVSIDPRVIGELAAFRSLREDLVRKWQEFSGQCLAYNIIKEENSNRAAFKRLLNEEQQAERASFYLAVNLANMTKVTMTWRADSPASRFLSVLRPRTSVVPMKTSRVKSSVVP